MSQEEQKMRERPASYNVVRGVLVLFRFGALGRTVRKHKLRGSMLFFG